MDDGWAAIVSMDSYFTQTGCIRKWYRFKFIHATNSFACEHFKKQIILFYFLPENDIPISVNYLSKLVESGTWNFRIALICHQILREQWLSKGRASKITYVRLMHLCVTHIIDLHFEFLNLRPFNFKLYDWIYCLYLVFSF